MDANDLQLKRLLSQLPAPDLVEELGVFGQFIGDWEFVMLITRSSGEQQTASGEWHFAWVLDGRAVQDIRIVFLGDELIEFGTMLRYYTKKLNAWRCVFAEPMTDQLYTFIARQQEDSIIMATDNKKSPEQRMWIFSHMSQESFQMQEFISANNGTNWQPAYEITAKRVYETGNNT